MMFDNLGSLTNDLIAQEERDVASRNASAYVVTNLRPPPSMSSDIIKQLHKQHASSRTWDGYGLNPLKVDDDSRMRLGSRATHGRSKRQLPKRVFTAIPDLASHNHDERVLDDIGTRGCSKSQVTETDFGRFDPGYTFPSVDHIIPLWTSGGAFSRDIARSRKFKQLLKCNNNNNNHDHWRTAASGLPSKLSSESLYL